MSTGSQSWGILRLRGTKTFGLVTLGQVLSMTGSRLSAFALGIWVFSRTESVTQLALVSFVSSFVAMLLSPFVGALVDRWADYRRTMLVSDLLECLLWLCGAALLFADSLEVWHIYLIRALAGAFGAFGGIAHTSSARILMPADQLARAHAWMSLGGTINQIVVPALAGVVVLNLHYKWIVLIDAGTFLVAIGAVAAVTFPPIPRRTGTVAKMNIIIGDLGVSWRYLKDEVKLLPLLIFFASTNLFLGLVGVLVRPLVLLVSTPVALGAIESVGGTAALLGSLLLSSGRGPKRRLPAVFGATAICACCMVAAAFLHSVQSLAVIGFVFWLVMPAIVVLTQAIWQQRVASEFQGCVLGIRLALVGSTGSLASLMAGPLSEGLFARRLGCAACLGSAELIRIFGNDKVGGIRLLFAVSGILCLVAVILALAYKPMRQLDDTLAERRAAHAASSRSARMLSWSSLARCRGHVIRTRVFRPARSRK